jgi:tetratricopeptide (TPR) repeat protein
MKAVEGRTDEAAARVHAELAGRYARVRIAQGRYMDAIRWSRRAIAEAEACGNRRALAQALEFLDVAQVAMGDVAGVGPAARALEIYTELGDSLGEGHANNDLGIRAYYQGRWLDALAHYEAARNALERAGDSWDAATTSSNIAELLLYWDRGDEAEPLLQRAMHIWRAAGAQPELAAGHEMLGQVAMRRGDYERAFDLLGLAHDYALAHGGNSAHRLEGLIAEAYVRAGQPEQALERVTETLRHAVGAEGSAGFIPMLNRVHGFALRDLGRTEEAREAFELSVTVARALGADHEIAFGLMALIELDASAAARADWTRELDALAPQLGLTTRIDRASDASDGLPEQRRPDDNTEGDGTQEPARAH